MSVTINGTTGLAGVDGSAGTPAVQGSDTNTGIFFPAADTVGITTNGNERVRVDSSGNVGIGTASPSNKLEVQSNTANSFFTTALTTSSAANGYLLNNNNSSVWGSTWTGLGIGTGTSHPIIFATGASERARIDTSGNLLVGYTAQVWDERILGYRSTNNVVGGFYSTSNAYTSSVIRCQTETTAGAGWYFFEGRAAGGGFQYGIRGNGTVATSDERRKKNIEPARSYLQDICNIPVVKYNWKTDGDDAPKELGWLAQDVQKVFPNMVVTHHDGQNDDQEVLLLKKEVFLPMLMKCIQEQQALITALTARITALEAKP